MYTMAIRPKSLCDDDGIETQEIPKGATLFFFYLLLFFLLQFLASFVCVHSSKTFAQHSSSNSLSTVPSLRAIFFM